MDVFYSEDYEENYFLVEAPPLIVESIKNNEELIIKGRERTILCTNDKSYELKYLETTNTYMLMNNNPNKKEIVQISNHTLECQEYTPKKFSVYNILKVECALSYDLISGEDNLSNFKIKYTLNELFSLSELSMVDFLKMINEFKIFEKNSYACLFDESFLFQILDDILVMISKENLNYENISIDEIFSNNFIDLFPKYKNVIPRLNNQEKNSIMMHLFDLESQSQSISTYSNFYKLNIDKVKLLCAKNIFAVKKEINFKLDDFIILLRNALRVSLPYQVIDLITVDNFEYSQTPAEDNIFEGYKEFDLRFLKGCCVVYFLKTQRDALIKYVDITNYSENLRERLNDLYKIKDKWTLNELRIFLRDLNINNVEEKLTNFTRLVIEANPFDSKNKINSFYLKYKLY